MLIAGETVRVLRWVHGTLYYRLNYSVNLKLYQKIKSYLLKEIIILMLFLLPTWTQGWGGELPSFSRCLFWICRHLGTVVPFCVLEALGGWVSWKVKQKRSCRARLKLLCGQWHAVSEMNPSTGASFSNWSDPGGKLGALWEEIVY